MLRALLLDSLLTLPVMFLPGMLATGVLVLSFVPFFAATLSNVVHILLYHAPISTFAIQSIFETTSNEAREFATDFFSIPNALRACLETHLSIMKRFNSMLAMAI